MAFDAVPQTAFDSASGNTKNRRDQALAIQIVDDLAGFLALKAEWDGLFTRYAAAHQVFQSHTVLRHWAAHYLTSDQALCIVTARQDDRLVMIWPLLRQRRLGFEILRLMGEPVAQFGDVLVEREGQEERLLAAGWRTVRGLGADLCELRRIRADAALRLVALPGDALPLETRQAPRADLDLRVGPDGPSSIYPARERSNYRRRLRRLNEHGAVGIGAYGPGREAARLTGEAVRMKQAALKRHGLFAPTVSDPRFAAFFHDLAGDGDSPIRITAITCNDTTIGIDIALDCRQTSFGHIIATHPSHERGGIGGILVHASFAAAKARGNRHFDLLAPADPYKRDHADSFTEVVDWMVPLSLKGRLACRLGLQNLRPVLKAALARLPPKLAKRLLAWARGGEG